MDNKNESMASAIVASMPGGESSALPDEAQEFNAEDVAVDEMFAAVKANDTGAFRDALRSFIQVVESQESESGE